MNNELFEKLIQLWRQRCSNWDVNFEGNYFQFVAGLYYCQITSMPVSAAGSKCSGE